MRALIFILLLCLGVISSPSFAKTRVPLGYQLMCLKTPQECQGGGANSVKATAEIMSLLKKVNSQVNARITERQDGSVDQWSPGVTAGDCEEYVLAKRRALIKAGIPASSLRITYVKTKQGVGHVVLVVRTNKGDFALDNLNPSVRPIGQTGYRIISSGTNPFNWS